MSDNVNESTVNTTTSERRSTMHDETSRTRPYGNLNDLTVTEICDGITSRLRTIEHLLAGRISPGAGNTVDQAVAPQRESLAGYMDLLHTYALKINPRGVVTQIAAGPDGIRTRIIEGP